MNLNHLNDIIEKKKSRLCFSADFTKKKDLLFWVNLVGPDICLLKTHIDILEDFDSEVVEKLLELKEKHNFLILEDRKFADIGKIFEKQLYGGLYKIGKWADIITMHGICCSGMLHYMDSLGKRTPKVLLVSQMSSACNLISTNYTYDCYDIANEYRDLVIGFISQKKFVEDDTFLFLTPGVSHQKYKSLDQRYRTPQQALEEDKNDIIIVGSGIYGFPPEEYQNNIKKYLI